MQSSPVFSFLQLFRRWQWSFCLVVGAISWLLTACEADPDTVKNIKPYDGPRIEVDTIETLYSDSARMVLKMNAPKQLEMQNGDQIFPKGVDIVFYERDGAVSATLRGNHARYIKEKRQYIVTGNVVVVSKKNNETVNTEELVWSQTTKKITTDKFVTITTPTEVIKGNGLESNQDFSQYRILDVTGIFTVDNAP